MKGEIFQEVRFIAETHHSAILDVALQNITLRSKIICVCDHFFFKISNLR